jgi:integrase
MREVLINGKDQRIEVDFGVIEGKRRRSFHKTKAEAKGAIAIFKEDQAESAAYWAELPARQRIDTAKTLRAIHATGTTLKEVWDFYQERQNAKTGVTLADAIRECIEAKKKGGMSDRYIGEISNYLRQFELDRGQLDVADITPSMIDQWFAGRKEAPATKQTGMQRLSALFSFCERRRYITENPLKRVERVRVPHIKPEILSVAECKALVEAAAKIDKGMLTYLGLALFCGIRPDEAKRLDKKKDIQLERGLVFLDAEKSKVRNRRIVMLTEPAKRCIEAGGPVPKSNFPKRFKALRDEAKLKKWPHDALRKTAASHFYNLYGIDKAVEQLGHSAGVMLNVYREIVSKEETEKWMGVIA